MRYNLEVKIKHAYQLSILNTMNFQLFLVKTIIMIENCRGRFTLTLIDGYKVGHLITYTLASQSRRFDSTFL